MHEAGPRPLWHIGLLPMATMGNPPGLALDGEIDEYAYPALAEKLGELAQGHDGVHADLTTVQHCDLAGLRAIVLLPNAGRTVLHGLSPHLQADLCVLGWDRTPGLIIDTSPPGFCLPPAHPDPEALHATASTKVPHC